MNEKIKSDLYLEVENKIESFLKELNFDFIDIEIVLGKNRKLSIFVYNKDKTDIDDLSLISNKLRPILETISFFQEGCLLEISSPGIYREIKFLKEFNIFKDREIKIITDESVVITGLLIGLNDDILYVRDKNGEKLEISLDKIKKAKLNG